MTLLTEKAAIAIANAQAYEAANRQAAIQKALRDITVAAVDAADLQSMLDDTLHAVLNALGLTMGSIWTGKANALNGMATYVVPVMAETAVAGQLQLHEAHVIADWESVNDPKLQQLKEKLMRYHIRASITVPIESGTRHLGGLSIADTAPHNWNSDEIELIESAGREIGNVALRWQLLEEIQRDAEQREEIIESVDEGILLLDADGRVMTTNTLGRAYLQLLHPQRGDAGEPATTRLSTLADYPLEALITPPAHGGRREIKVNRRTFRIAVRELKSGSLSGKWVLALQEATMEKEMQEQLQRQERLAVVGQLAAGIAHDFNNIMSVNILFAQLGMRTPGIPLKLQERLQTIYDQSKRAATLIDQILDFSRSAVLERTPLNLITFLKEITKLLDRTLPENIRVKMRYGEGRYIVSADPTRMQQVIMNLAINARDAMPQGGQLTFGLDNADSLPPMFKPLQEEDDVETWVRLTVSDNGTGIPDDVLPHIFEPFFTTKPPGRGTGLGLAQVYGIVKQHGGEITVLSQIGKGTTFVVYLPLLKEIVPTAPAKDSRNVTGGRGEIILVVEDDPSIRGALVDSLQELNYQSITAINGEEALAILAEQHDRIALILSDVIMPKMGGIDLFRAVRDRYPNIKFILLSGHPRNHTLTEAEQKALTAWLDKPIDLSQLAETLAHILG